MSRLDSTSTTLLDEQERKRLLTVLVVDDEKDVRESVCEMLEARGYQVVCAEDGRAALEHLRGGLRPDVILLDLMMPGMNGWQFRDEMNRDAALAGIPVVVITATRNVRQIHAEEIVHKPIKPDLLLRVVEKWGRSDAPRGGTVGAAHTAAIPAREVTPVERMPASGSVEIDRTALFSDRFIEMLGHDLRNPLSAISITGGLLGHHARTPEVAEPTARILAIVDRMDLMIGHLMDFLRVCLGREMPLDRRTVDMRDVCDNVVRVLSPAAKREINVEVTGEANGMWDRGRLEMLLSTLMTDAFDRDQSGAAVHIRVDGSHDDNLQLVVEHRGIHSHDLLSPSRETFENAERSIVEEQCTRLGLGMYIAHQIVLAHGGRMSTESDTSRGTRFNITLPRNAAP
jgi:CheY-like chemotaxis protein